MFLNLFYMEKRTIGLGLVLAGIFLILVQPFSPTGAVIDLSTAISRVEFGIGLIFMILGFILMRFGEIKKYGGKLK